jgi:2-furoate---CoA ligase
MQTAYDLVWLAAERTPDHVAIVDDRTARALTYRALIAEIDAIAAGLAARGVRAGMRIATALPNSLEHCLVLLALQRLAAVPALLNFRLKPDEVVTLVGQGDIEGAVIGADAALGQALAAALGDGALLLSVGGAAPPAVAFEDCRGDPSSLPAIPRPDPDDAAFIFYTSGTTGLPKGAVLAHRTSEHRVVWLSSHGGLRCGTHNRVLGLVPLFHVIGFHGVFLATLAYNGTYYIMSAFDPARAVEMIERHEISYLFAVPTHFHAMVNAPNYRPERVASVTLALFGGAAIDGTLLARLDREWQARLHHIYGTTETMCALHHPDPVGRPTILRPGYYSRIRIIRPGGGADDEVAIGAEGELIVDARADTMFSGYLHRPEETAEKLKGGWYYTGDVCLRLDGGDVEMRGRVDDMIRTGGESVHPEEVEAILAAHPGVREVSVVGVRDARWGEIVVACITAHDARLDAATLEAYCRASTLARHKRPRGYVFFDQLPRNAANKVLRRLLRESAAAARAGEGDTEFHTPAG